MFRLIIVAAIGLMSLPANAQETDKIQPYEEYNGFKVWTDFQSMHVGNGATCRLGKEFPNNGVTKFLISNSIHSIDSTYLSMSNANWTVKPNPNNEFEFRFGFPEILTSKMFYIYDKVENNFLVDLPTQRLLDSMAIGEQLRVSYNLKIIADLNLNGIEPAINAFKRCLSHNTAILYQEQKRRIRSIRDGIGQEYLSAEPNPFLDQ